MKAIVVELLNFCNGIEIITEEKCFILPRHSTLFFSFSIFLYKVWTEK